MHAKVGIVCKQGISGFFALVQCTGPFEWRRINECSIKSQLHNKKKSRYQTIKLRKTKSDLVLYLNNTIQVHSKDDQLYHEAVATLPMLLAKRIRRIAVLGGGDGLAIRNILNFKNMGELFLVELDKAVLDFCRTNPDFAILNNNSLSDPRVKITNADAFRWFTNARGKFDVIIFDLEFIATDQPSHVTLEVYRRYFKAVLKKLAPGGVYQITVSNDAEELASVEALFKVIRSELPQKTQQRFLKSRSLKSKIRTLLRAFFGYVVIWTIRHKFLGTHLHCCASNKPLSKFYRYPLPQPRYITRKLLKKFRIDGARP